MGGAKVSDKIGFIKALLGKVDQLLIGGEDDLHVPEGAGQSTSAARKVDGREARRRPRRCSRRSAGKIVLPVDHLVVRSSDDLTQTQVVEGDIPDGCEGVDIGPKTIAAVRRRDQQGRHGRLERPDGLVRGRAFSKGTQGIAEAMAASAARHRRRRRRDGRGGRAVRPATRR